MDLISEVMKSEYALKAKAYRLNIILIEEGYLMSDLYCYADKLSEAKSKLLKEILYENLKRKNDDDITYLNIPVIRAYELDKYDFEGSSLTMSQITDILAQRERFKDLDSIASNPSIEFCYIKKRGTYYMPNSCGYTSYSTEAGVYPKLEAISHAKYCDELSLVPVNKIAHNQAIYDKIKNLESRLIA